MKLKLKQIAVAPGGLTGLDVDGAVWILYEKPFRWEPVNMEVPSAEGI